VIQLLLTTRVNTGKMIALVSVTKTIVNCDCVYNPCKLVYDIIRCLKISILLNEGGTRKLSIYSPYVIINKSCLDLAFKATSMVLFQRSAAGQGSKSRQGSQELVEHSVESQKKIMARLLARLDH
jgi:hypothetical protein